MAMVSQRGLNWFCLFCDVTERGIMALSPLWCSIRAELKAAMAVMSQIEESCICHCCGVTDRGKLE